MVTKTKKIVKNGKGTLDTARVSKNRLEVPPIRVGSVKLRVEGTSPLIIHSWDQKVIDEMADKQGGKATKKKEPKDPRECYFGCMYILDGEPRVDQSDDLVSISSEDADAIHGVPCASFRKSMVRAAKLAGAVMTDTRCGFLIKGSTHHPYFQSGTLTELEFDSVERHRDMVRISGGTADIRYRPYYTGWSAVLTIDYTSSMIEVDQLVNLARLAGYSVGVGEWRPERDGIFGRFQVDPKGISDVVYTEL